MLKDLKKQLSVIEAKINSLGEEREAIRQKIAELSTPLKVGDRVTFDGAKDIWELREIKPGYGDGTSPKYFGAKLKKDGTPGASVFELYMVPYGKELRVVTR